MKLRESDISQRSASQAKLKEIMLEGLSKFSRIDFHLYAALGLVTIPAQPSCSGSLVVTIGRSDIFEILSWTPKAFCAYTYKKKYHCGSVRENVRWKILYGDRTIADTGLDRLCEIVKETASRH